MSGDIELMLQTDVVRVQLEEPRRNGLYFVPIFLMRKISHTCRRSSFFAKRHARLACSLVNALTTAYCRYHLFAIQAPSAHKYPKGSYRPHPSKPYYANEPTRLRAACGRRESSSDRRRRRIKGARRVVPQHNEMSRHFERRY